MHIYVAKLLSIGVTTYIHVYHLWNLRHPANLLCTQRINFSTCAWRATPLSFIVSFLENQETASENAENCRCWQTQCRLTPPPQGTSTNIRIILILPETTVTQLHFCYRQYGSIFIHIFVVGSEKCIFSAIACVSAVQGHPRSSILAPNCSKGHLWLPISH